jgi:dihydrofolate reductase
MRKVIYGMSVSLDGYIEAKDGDISWTNPDEELHRYFNGREKAIDLHLYGRRIYEIMAAAWSTPEENPAAEEYIQEYAQIWKAFPKIVFSTTLKQVGWNARLVRENIADEVKMLKEQLGGDMSVSGAGLAASFMQLGLIDEFWLYVRPVILGGGKPMFGSQGNKIPLQLVETRQFGQGVLMLRYQRMD